MGASDAFDARADFTGINKDPTGLYISKVIHKAVVEVNEEGTEAAAATAVIMMTRCMRIEPPPEEFKCDRPFIFLIHDNQDNTVLFLGKYSKP
jgi:serpin B